MRTSTQPEASSLKLKADKAVSDKQQTEESYYLVLTTCFLKTISRVEASSLERAAN